VSQLSTLNEAAAVQRSGVDLDRAIQCVELAQLSYAASSQAQRLALGRHGYRHFESLAGRGGRDYLLLVDDGTARIIAVRGSDDVWDWLTNARFWHSDSPVGRVHTGFLEAATTLLASLDGRLDERPVYFTGHSMGGAVASLMAALRAAGGAPVAGVYTFGQPQVGLKSFNDQFRRQCSFPYFRFVHGADALAAWTLGRQGAPGVPCYFDLKGRVSFGQQLTHVPRLGLKFHRLEQYRYFLRLSRMRLRAAVDSDDVTAIQRR
jgi:pimeloyl-ACP methyl ester carboxylesterase